MDWDWIGSLGLVEYRAPYGANKVIKWSKWKRWGKNMEEMEKMVKMEKMEPRQKASATWMERHLQGRELQGEKNVLETNIF